jgi:hypothetical protein
MILVLLEQLLVLYLVLRMRAENGKFPYTNILSNGQFNVVPKLAVLLMIFWIYKELKQLHSFIQIYFSFEYSKKRMRTEKKLFQ